MRQCFFSFGISICLLGLVNSGSAYAVYDSKKPEKSHSAHAKSKVNNGSKSEGCLCGTDHRDPTVSKKTIVRQEIHADTMQPQISGPVYLPRQGYQYFPYDLEVPGQSFVSTGPYIGVPLQYAGNNLIINTPSINQDVALLDLRKNINARMCALGLNPESQHSHLLLSGVVEGQVNYANRSSGSNSSDIDLTSAAIDAYILGPSTWTSGLISLAYDNSIGANEGSLNTQSRTQNSRVYITKAFVVVGNFSVSPVYFTIGQMYVPFGVYSTNMVSSPLTKLLARTQARAVLLGLQQQAPNAFYGSIYAYKGDSHTGTTRGLNGGGINAGVKFDDCRDHISGNVGVGIIANIADSQGMQNTGNGDVVAGVPVTFGGFGGALNTGNEKIQHRVPAGNIHGLLSIGKSIDLLAEYVAATKPFSSQDLTMNGHSARPQALALEATYTFQCIVQPTSIAAGYGMTKDALALGLPSKRWSLVLNTSFWRNTLQSIELRHDINYGNNNTSSGSLIPGPTPGGSDNLVTAQFDIYF